MNKSLNRRLTLVLAFWYATAHAGAKSGITEAFAGEGGSLGSVTGNKPETGVCVGVWKGEVMEPVSVDTAVLTDTLSFLGTKLPVATETVPSTNGRVHTTRDNIQSRSKCEDEDEHATRA